MCNIFVSLRDFSNKILRLRNNVAQQSAFNHHCYNSYLQTQRPTNFTLLWIPTNGKYIYIYMYFSFLFTLIHQYCPLVQINDWQWCSMIDQCKNKSAEKCRQIGTQFQLRVKWRRCHHLLSCSGFDHFHLATPRTIRLMRTTTTSTTTIRYIVFIRAKIKWPLHTHIMTHFLFPTKVATCVRAHLSTHEPRWPIAIPGEIYYFPFSP